VNVWSFGKNTISQSNALRGDDKPLKGVERDNDCTFYPRLRYDPAKGSFYFVTDQGPAQSVTAEVAGFYDGEEVKPLSVKITATIKEALPLKPATQPATVPASTPAAEPGK
jgi:hypothetical protein